MSRSMLMIAPLLAMLAVVHSETAFASVGHSDVPPNGRAGRLDADTMKAALRTATPEENGFIDYVLALVEAERLPPSLVHSTFQWARKKPRYRFQYFRRGLIIRARRQGIRL